MFIPNDGTNIPESSYGVLPENTKVQVTILPTNKGGNTIVKRPFAKQGVNASLTALAIRVSIDEGQAGAKRNLFVDIALARKFASGHPNYNFGSFFRALGYNIDAPDGFNVPEDRELMSKKLEVVLGIDESGDEPRNVIKFINKAAGIITSQPTRAAETRTPAASTPPWTPGAANPQAAQPAAAASGFTPPGAAAASAAPAAGGFTPPPATEDAWKVSPKEAAAVASQYADAGASNKF